MKQTYLNDDKNCGLVFSFRDGVDLSILGRVTAGAEAIGFWSAQASATSTMVKRLGLVK